MRVFGGENIAEHSYTPALIHETVAEHFEDGTNAGAVGYSMKPALQLPKRFILGRFSCPRVPMTSQHGDR